MSQEQVLGAESEEESQVGLRAPVLQSAASFPGDPQAAAAPLVPDSSSGLDGCPGCIILLWTNGFTRTDDTLRLRNAWVGPISPTERIPSEHFSRCSGQGVQCAELAAMEGTGLRFIQAQKTQKMEILSPAASLSSSTCLAACSQGGVGGGHKNKSHHVFPGMEVSS